MKRSGYRIRLEWFVPFDPETIEGIELPKQHMDAAKEFLHLTVLKTGGMLANIQTKYQARRELPDEPKAAMQPASDAALEQPDMPPLPASLRRA